MGHGNTTTDEAVAKNTLLERDFKEIADLESISQSEFRHGMIGAKFLPGVFISKIPRVVEPAGSLGFDVVGVIDQVGHDVGCVPGLGVVIQFVVTQADVRGVVASHDWKFCAVSTWCKRSRSGVTECNPAADFVE